MKDTCRNCGTALPYNIELDGTDYAHPSYWRGHEHAVIVLCKMVNDILDGKEPTGISKEPWESTRKRIAQMCKKKGDSNDC